MANNLSAGVNGTMTADVLELCSATLRSFLTFYLMSVEVESAFKYRARLLPFVNPHEALNNDPLKLNSTSLLQDGAVCLAVEETQLIRDSTAFDQRLLELGDRRKLLEERGRLVMARPRFATTVSRLEDKRDELQVDTNEGPKSERLPASGDETMGRMLGELERRREELERSKSKRHELEERIEAVLASSELIRIFPTFHHSH